MIDILSTYWLLVLYNLQIDTVKIEVQQFHEVNSNRSTLGTSMSVNLDIPESVGLSAPLPAHSTSRLVDLDIGNIGRRGKRKI